MPTTIFYSPTSIQQISSVEEATGRPSIPWTHSELVISKDSYAVSQQPLYCISGLWMEKFRSKTNALWCTGFNIPNVNSAILGIEFQLNIQRAGRIQDLIIQLTKDGLTLAGENRASEINSVQTDMNTGDFTTPLHPVGDFNVYGSSTDLWGDTWTSTEISSSTFGIVISFQSNPIIPHRDLAYVDQVALRITYA